MMDFLLIISLTIILVIAAVIDFRIQKIPNLLTYPAMVAALAYHCVTNGLDGLLFSVGGFGLGIAIFIMPYLLGGMGAGDAKLMGAVGAALGAKGVFVSALLTALIGGIYAVLLILFRYKECQGVVIRTATTIKTFAFTGQFVTIPAPENEKKPKLCYGIAIATGALSYIALELSGYDFFF